MATITTTASTTTSIALTAQDAPRPSQRETAIQGPSSSSSTINDPILEESRNADLLVPDGGKGWAVVAACAVVSWLFTSPTYTWGVFQSAFVEEGISSPSTLAYVGSLPSACISVFAIVNARLVCTIGVRRTAVLGVTFLGLAALLSSFTAHNIVGLFFTAGLALGIGTALCFISVTSVPAQYFSRKRGLANGIIFAGGGLGGAAMSFVNNALIEKLGVAWTYRFVAGLTFLVGLPAAIVITERVPLRPRPLVDRTLLKNGSFLIIFAAGAIGTFPVLVPPFFLPLFGQSIGLSASTSAGLLAGFNLSSGVGRILSGFFCDKYGALNTLLLSCLLNGATMLALWPFSVTTPALAAFVAVNGISNGSFFATMPTVVGNVFGSSRVSVAMGMTVTGWAAGYLMGAPVAGNILDAFGGTEKGLRAYRPAMYYAGGMALLSGGLVLCAKLRQNKRFLAKV